MTESYEEQLRLEVVRLGNELRDTTKRWHEAIIANAPFKVGDEVEEHERGAWTPVIVRKVHVRYDRLAYSASYRKKNGEWADRVHEVWNGLRA